MHTRVKRKYDMNRSLWIYFRVLFARAPFADGHPSQLTGQVAMAAVVRRVHVNHVHSLSFSRGLRSRADSSFNEKGYADIEHSPTQSRRKTGLEDHWIPVEFKIV